MDHLDTSWCPVCERQIVPKRYEVPVGQPAAPAPALVPTVVDAKTTTRTKSNGGRPRGLVHGTGRARPALKRAHSKQSTSPAPTAPASETAKSAGPVKTKSVIDSNPLPLYCSDDCRLSDLHKLDDGFSYDFNPERHPSPSASTLTTSCSTEPEVESPTGSDDTDSTSTTSEYSHASARSYHEMDPSIATLAAIYGFPDLPPPPPTRSSPAPKVVTRLEDEYVSGIMMAGQRIKETLCPEPARKSAFSSPTARYTNNLNKTRKPIAGWTDGTGAWRADVYSLSAPRDWTVVDPKNPENRSTAYGTCVAAAHRSCGVVSTLGEGPSASVAAAVAARSSSKPSPDALQELYGNYYPLFNSERSDSRTRMYSGSAHSLPTRPTSSLSERRTRECGILPKQAEGKLLVPNVKLRRNTSSATVASVSSIGSNGPRSPRMLTRRGSAMSDDVIHEEDETVTRAAPSSSLPTTMRAPAVRKPVDEPFTYAYMIPMVKEMRVRRQIVDGVERDELYEVMVPKEVEPLFLGPDGVNQRRERRKRAEAEARRAEAACRF